ncbi:uncharacterized protein LOC121368344 [Gigantopelta aegis]|uniref:uncharacterized protein LOC121368344 n=1 Tax=Gigantopelta aegis TaxID=1735272 RepID=UPI001B88A0AD|nr:uncharacterized protein LOC121368344 [Gigantopelta aegis]
MAENTVLTFLEAVKIGQNRKELKKSLQDSSKANLMGWKDEHSMDVLHHAILLNSPEAVQLLLSEGYFQAPYQPSVNLYAHLTCHLGYRTILNLLLEYRADDFRVLGTVVLPGQYWLASKDQVGDIVVNSSVAKCPLDIAADEGHIKCVKTILNMFVLKANPDAPSKGDVTLACLADSPNALTLVLKEKQRSDDIKHAMEFCLRQPRPQCLDILLKLDVDTSSLFKHMNFYHVLYTYSSKFDEHSYSLLPQMTTVLIDNGYSVNAKSPPRTYPIYSLLSHAFCICNYENTKYYIECLQMLLKNGADPCFDEVAFERSQLKHGKKAAVGRHSFSSGLHCLLETVEDYAIYLDSRALAVKFVLECADTLVRFNASVRQVGRIGGNTSSLLGNVLHQYAKSSATIGVDLEIIRCILRHGANPDDKVGGKYAINVFIDKLYEKLKADEPADAEDKYKQDAKHMLTVCEYMRNSAIREATRINRLEHSREISRFVKPYVEFFKEELNKKSSNVKSLRRLSSWIVWKRCGMKANNVYLLKVTARVKTDIIPLCDGTATPFVLGV